MVGGAGRQEGGVEEEEGGMLRPGQEPRASAPGSEPVSHWLALDTNKKRRSEPEKLMTSVAQMNHRRNHGRFSVWLPPSTAHHKATPTGLQGGTSCSAFSG